MGCKKQNLTHNDSNAMITQLIIDEVYANNLHHFSVPGDESIICIGE